MPELYATVGSVCEIKFQILGNPVIFAVVLVGFCVSTVAALLFSSEVLKMWRGIIHTG
jgi:hypothetical protein